MNLFRQFRLLLQLSHAQNIGRRYLVANGFDGSLAMLGIIVGFYSNGDAELQLVIRACMGAAIALLVSGLTSAYISETAERERELQEMEQALLTDLSASHHALAARLAPIYIALINGLSPFIAALLIISPLWATQQGLHFPIDPLLVSVATSFAILFALGAFLGRISGRFWLWSALRTLLIALITSLLILLMN